MCLSLENKRLLRALIAFFQVWALHQPNVTQFRDGPVLRGSLIPSSPSENLPGFAGFGFPWKLTLWVRFFQQEVTKVTKSAYVSLCRFASLWCILVLRICSRLHWLLPSPARSQLFSWEKETTHPPFLGARAVPAPDPPQLQPLIPGLGGCKSYLTRSIWGICAFSCSFHSLQLLLFGFFPLQGLFLHRKALGTCAGIMPCYCSPCPHGRLRSPIPHLKTC